MLWVERLHAYQFPQLHACLALEAGPEPQVLIGANGAGKTNLLEAVSLLAPGQGMRRAAYPDLARGTGDGGWAVAAHTAHAHRVRSISAPGCCAENADVRSARGRVVRINGETGRRSGALADYVEVVWVTPAMDGLFTGPGSERRRFLDRLILCFDPGYRTVAGHFERAMQQRNRLLADGVRDDARFEGLELLMAETGRRHRGGARRGRRRAWPRSWPSARARDPTSPFPARRARARRRAGSGSRRLPAVEVEDTYVQRCATGASATGPRAARSMGRTAPICSSRMRRRRCRRGCAPRASRRRC